MAKLSREDALRFYKRYYAPNNAILVVSGDVTAEEVKRLAEETYGKVPANPDVDGRVRPQEPPQIAARRLELKDPRAGNASFHRYYIAPSYSTAKPGEAEALDLLMQDRWPTARRAGSTRSSSSRRRSRRPRAATTPAGASTAARSRFTRSPATASASPRSRRRSTRVLDEVRANGVTAAELERAKKTFLADYVYESDNQATLARRYGWGLAVGRGVSDIESWPDGDFQGHGRRREEGGGRVTSTCAAPSPAGSCRRPRRAAARWSSSPWRTRALEDPLV